MRNLRRYLAVAIAVAMLFTMFAPVAFAAGESATDDAQALHDLGLYKGISETSFNPDLASTLNRQTGATMLLRLFGLEQDALATDLTEAKATVRAKFKDASSIADWAVKQVAYAVDQGVINGFPDGTFQPNGLLTGRQFCTLILNQLGYKGKFQFETAGDKYAEVAGLSKEEAAKFGVNSAIKKDVLVSASVKALGTKLDGKNTTLIQELVKSGAVAKEKAKEESKKRGWPDIEQPTPTPVPTTPTGSATPTPSVTGIYNGVVYGRVNVTAVMAAATSVAKGQALIEAGKITLTAASDTQVTGLKLTRNGLSADSDIKNITVWDGALRLNTPTIFSNSVADVAFSNALTIKAGESKVLSVKFNVKNDSSVKAGNQIIISLANSGVVKAAVGTIVEGTFPYTSGAFTIADVTLGKMMVEIASDAPTADSYVDPKKDVRVAKFKITALNEAITIKQMVFTQVGSVSDSDIEALKLYRDSDQIGSAVKLSNRKAIFEFATPIELAQGGNAFITMKADLISGSGRDLKMNIEDKNDFQATGKTFGTTLGAQFDTNDTTDSLTGRRVQIKEGSFVLSEDATTKPASAKISTTTNDTTFEVIKVEAVGEPIKLEQVLVEGRATGNGTTGVRAIKDVKLVANGSILKQVQEPFSSAADSTTAKNATIDITPTTVIPGTPLLIQMTADIDAGATSSTYTLGIPDVTAAAGDVQLKGTGTISGKTIYLKSASGTLSGVRGNSMEVGTLQVTAAHVPASELKVFKNDSAKNVVSFKIKHNLNEDVLVSNIYLDFDQTALMANLKNIRLVSESGVQLAEVASTPTDEMSVNFYDSIRIKPSQEVIIKVLADVVASPDTSTNGGVLKIGLGTTKGGTAIIANSGTDLGATGFPVLAPANGSNVTFSAGGTSFSVTRSTALNVETGNIYRGASDVVLAGYKFLANNPSPEAAKVTKLTLAPLTSSTAAVKEVTEVQFTSAVNANETIILENKTLTDDGAGSLNSVAKIAAAFVAATPTTNYDITLKSGTTDTIVLTARTACDMNDLTASAFTGTGPAGGRAARTVTVTRQGCYAYGKEVTEVQFTAGVAAGKTVIFDGETFTDGGGGSTAAQVAAGVAAFGTTTNGNYVCSMKPGTTDTVVITAATVGNKTDITSALFTGNGAYTIVITVKQQGASSNVAENQYVQNIKIYNGSTLIKTVGTLNASTEITLDTPFEVAAYSSSNSAPTEIKIVGSVALDAPLNYNYGLRLDGYEYQPKLTGTTTTTVTSLGMSTGPNGGDAIFTIGASKITSAKVSIANTAPKSSATGGGKAVVVGTEVGAFTLKNEGNEPVRIEKIGFLNAGTSGVTSTFEIYNDTDAKTFGTATLSSNAGVATADADKVVTLDKNQTKTFRVYVYTAGNLVDPQIVRLQVDKYTTQYDSAADAGYALSIDNTATLDSVTITPW